jgi:hypothetical protein
MKHGQEKSDLFIVALKPTNKPGRLGAELVEPRERTEGNMGEQHTYRTLCRIKRVPEARLCTRSCSWDSSLTTRGGSPVRESRPPGSVRRVLSNGHSYRDRRTSHMCAAANGLRALNFPCASRLVVSQRVVPGEIKVLPSDGGGMAKRLVVDLKCRVPARRPPMRPPDEQLPPAT